MQEGEHAAFKDSAYHPMSAPEEANEQKTKNGMSVRRKVQRARASSPKDPTVVVGETAKAVQPTPTRRKRQKEEGGMDTTSGDGPEYVRISGNRGGRRTQEKPLSKALTDPQGKPEDEIHESIPVRLGPAEEEGQDELKQTPLRSSGRQRQPKRRFLEPEKAAPTPTKSPSRKRGRPPKAAPVTVQPAVREVEMQFEDIPRKAFLKPAGSGNKKNSSLVDSISVDVNSPTGTAIAVKAKESQPTGDLLKHLLSILRDDKMAEPFSLLKSQILEGLTGKRRLPLIGLDEEYQKVYQLVQQTVVAGEGNSMLIIGARGTAKTALVETVISQLIEDHREEFYVVRLNGFVHTDDKLALKEIWRQLGREMEVEDEAMGIRSNYADTLTSLLALLSHPAEHSATATDSVQTSKSVVFVIDEFDLFATHSRQTLLYNLFDIAQSRKAPIAVLGLTTKVSVVESLEKRVKSRFSHRYVYLSLSKTYGTFRDICRSILLCEATEAPSISMVSSAEFKGPQSLSRYLKLCTAWSKYMTSILTEDTAVSRLLRRIYAHTKSIPDAMAAFLMPIVSMSPTSIPSAADFTSNTLLSPDSKLHILPGLSEIELALLISAARLDVILDTDTCNFSMAYDEYMNLATRAKLMSSASGAAALGGASRVWSREVAMGAWERLETLDLLVLALGAGGGGGVTDVGRAGKLWKVDVGLEEIGGSRLEMSSVMMRWCKEI